MRDILLRFKNKKQVNLDKTERKYGVAIILLHIFSSYLSSIF